MHTSSDDGAMHRHAGRARPHSVPVSPLGCEIVTLRVDAVPLRIVLESPARPTALVLMLYAGKAPMRSAPAHYIARKLRARGFATALVDLAPDRPGPSQGAGGPSATRFNVREGRASPAHIDQDLANRVKVLARWLDVCSPLGVLPMVCLAAGRAAGAALRAAVRGAPFRSVITLSGRCENVRRQGLMQLHLPVLMIAASGDARGIRDNDSAFQKMACPRQLRLIPSADAIVEQPAELAAVVSLCAGWIEQLLGWPADTSQPHSTVPALQR